MITLGDILYGAHVGFQALTRPFRERRAIAAVQAVSDAKDANSQGLYWAAFYGHTKCVEQLIPVCGPKAEALRAAIEGGSVDCVELLLPFCDPMEQSFDGLTAHDLALQEGRAEVAAIIGRFIKQEREVEKLPSILLTKWKKERADGAPKSEREPKGEQLSQ